MSHLPSIHPRRAATPRTRSAAALIPTGQARELPDDEAWRALFDDFGLFDSEPTAPMPLPEVDELELDAPSLPDGGAR